jgi:hypothetical protein
MIRSSLRDFALQTPVITPGLERNAPRTELCACDPASDQQSGKTWTNVETRGPARSAGYVSPNRSSPCGVCVAAKAGGNRTGALAKAYMGRKRWAVPHVAFAIKSSSEGWIACYDTYSVGTAENFPSCNPGWSPSPRNVLALANRPYFAARVIMNRGWRYANALQKDQRRTDRPR